ncbi:hypothetical protein U1Q18_040546 [Sarracenia purpurea var. burkii]
MLKTTRGYLELNTEVRLGAVVCCDGSFKLGAFHGVCFESLFCISKFSIFIEVDLNFGALCIDFQLLKKMRALHAGRRVWL